MQGSPLRISEKPCFFIERVRSFRFHDNNGCAFPKLRVHIRVFCSDNPNREIRKQCDLLISCRLLFHRLSNGRCKLYRFCKNFPSISYHLCSYNDTITRWNRDRKSFFISSDVFMSKAVIERKCDVGSIRNTNVPKLQSQFSGGVGQIK